MNSRFSKGLIAILIATLFMGAVSLPDSVKSNFPDWPVFSWAKKQKIKLGLDLQGGTQLDYRIDLRSANARNEDDDDSNDVRIHDVIEGVRTTIERRVNGLGVSEPQIYLSNVAGEDHIIVELAGIKNIEEAKAVVGKTIQLEFKEQKTEMDPEEVDKIKAEANEILAKAKASGADFTEVGKASQTGDNKIEFRENQEDFVSELPQHYKDILPKMKAGDVYKDIIDGSDGYMVGAGGNLSEIKTLVIVQLIEKGNKEREIDEQEDFKTVADEIGAETSDIADKTLSSFPAVERDALDITGNGKISDVIESDGELKIYKVGEKKVGDKQVKASHILIGYQGAERSEATRTKEEAKKRAEEVLKKAQDDPDNFAELAKEYSDGPTGPTGGDLGFFGKDQMTKAFEDAAFSMEKGEVSDIVETEFGYHIIKLTDINETTDTKVTATVMTLPASEENRTKMEGALERVRTHKITKQENYLAYNEIVFDITPDPWKSTGLDGSHFKYATVTYSQIGSPQVSIQFDDSGAELFADITERLVGKPLAIFVGGELISAPRVNDKITGGSAVITGNYDLKEALQLANDLNTGAIDAPIILTGQYTISATLGDNALQFSLYAGLVGLIALVIFMILYYRLMGIFAVIALGIYSVIIVFVLNTTGIVMTLAGIAGIILSIGMAVDANILIFERTKEELNEGKNFTAATATGFERAWTSIRDSNVSSLITCAILWFFGNSIIKGFALMLGLGIVVSMFTAITVTKAFLQTIIGSWLAKNRFLLGTKKVEIVNK